MQELFGRLDTAIYETVHGFRPSSGPERGSIALAPRCGMNPGTLSNKANPEIHTTHLGLAESIPVQLVAKNFSILHAYSSALGHATYRLPEHSNASDVEILDAYAKVQERCGLKARAIRDALRDGNVTHAEVAAIRECLDNEIRAGLELMCRFESLAR